MIPQAYAYGLTPPVDPDLVASAAWLSKPLSLEEAAKL
jgi:hypothetical protein